MITKYINQTLIKPNLVVVVFALLLSCASAEQPVDADMRPFSAATNYMSAIGYARWKYFQEFKKWPPSVIEEVIAESPVSGGFDWRTFLRAAQGQSKQYPYARKFVNSWHIDTIGPDWRDDYYIVKEYRRSEGAVYDPYVYKGPKPLFPLNDTLLSQLLKEWDAVYAKTKNINEADNKMMELWTKHKTTPG